MEKVLDLKNTENYDKLDKIAEVLKNGGIVAFPTETVYGIGADCLNEEAIKKLYRVKKRPLDNPISLLVSNVDMIENVVEKVNDVEYKLIKAFFPGPLTLVIKKKKIISNILTANLENVGIRMPNNEIAIRLIEYLNMPIATTSANISGNPSGTSVEDVIQEFGEKIDYYIDGGKSKIGKGSTVAQVMEDGSINIIREGSITLEQMLEAIKTKNSLDKSR